MQTQTITTYKFDELNKEAQEVAIEAVRNSEWYLDYEWYDFIYEDFIEKVKTLGYYDIKPYFSGFSSQGDGACFIAKIDVCDYLKSHKLKTKYARLYKETSENGHTVSITHSSHYYYSTSTSVDDDYYYTLTDKVQAQLDEVIKLIEGEREELGDKLYKDLQNEYDALLEDETIADFLISNEYDFTELGKRSIYI